MKSEPDVFSFDDLLAAPKKTSPWDGVRNYQARNFMRDHMKVGDNVLFYHSSCEVPGIAGWATIASSPRTDVDPWVLVDVKAKVKFPNFVSLSALRAESRLKNMLVLRKGQRLSIQPVEAKDFAWIIEHMSGLS